MTCFLRSSPVSLNVRVACLSLLSALLLQSSGKPKEGGKGRSGPLPTTWDPSPPSGAVQLSPLLEIGGCVDVSFPDPWRFMADSRPLAKGVGMGLQ